MAVLNQNGPSNEWTVQRPVSDPMHCVIRVRGQFDPSWSDWFDGLTITDAPNGEALLRGELPDQAALYGVLGKVRDLGLPLLGLECRTVERNSESAK